MITCLPSPAAVSAVVSGPGGIARGPGRGGTWIDMSTNDAHEIERLAALLAERGIATLECPVTGGVHKAAAGEITVIAGGDEAVFAAHRELLEAIGGRVIHVGPLGKASVIKVITNMLAFIHLVAAGEALMLPSAAGIDARDGVRGRSARARATRFVHETESQVILNGSLRHRLHDGSRGQGSRLRLDLGRELGVPLELAALVEETFLRARRSTAARPGRVRS